MILSFMLLIANDWAHGLQGNVTIWIAPQTRNLLMNPPAPLVVRCN